MANLNKTKRRSLFDNSESDVFCDIKSDDPVNKQDYPPAYHEDLGKTIFQINKIMIDLKETLSKFKIEQKVIKNSAQEENILTSSQMEFLELLPNYDEYQHTVKQFMSRFMILCDEYKLKEYEDRQTQEKLDFLKKKIHEKF